MYYHHNDLDKGRHSKEETGRRMVQEAEKYKVDDEAAASCITSENTRMTSSPMLIIVTDDKLAGNRLRRWTSPRTCR